jgi:hypothetical protein
MTRKALARRIAELLFNEPATRRGAGAAPTRRAARILAGCFVARQSKTTAGNSRSSRRAPSQNSRQRCYTSLRLGAPSVSPFFHLHLLWSRGAGSRGSASLPVAGASVNQIVKPSVPSRIYSGAEKQSYFARRRYANTPTRRHASPAGSDLDYSVQLTFILDSSEGYLSTLR